MPRGRKPKQPVLTELEEKLKNVCFSQLNDIEILYKNLAKIRYQVDLALTHVGQIDGVDSLAEASFKAGRAYGPLDEANDRLEEVLEKLFEENDFQHWTDTIEEN